MLRQAQTCMNWDVRRQLPEKYGYKPTWSAAPADMAHTHIQKSSDESWDHREEDEIIRQMLAWSAKKFHQLWAVHCVQHRIKIAIITEICYRRVQLMWEKPARMTRSARLNRNEVWCKWDVNKAVEEVEVRLHHSDVVGSTIHGWLGLVYVTHKR